MRVRPRRPASVSIALFRYCDRCGRPTSVGAVCAAQQNRPDALRPMRSVTRWFCCLFDCAGRVDHRVLSYLPSASEYTPVSCVAASESGGGAEEARTPDPLLAKEVLSQLSYGPLLPRVRRQSSDVGTYRPLTFDIPRTRGMVGHSGLEPETSVLSGLRSNQLS